MTAQKTKLQLFQKQQVRSVWDEENEKWWFSVLDVVGILTEQPDYTKTRNYWKWLKGKLTDEGSELVSNTNQLKLPAADGKKYLTDVMDTEQILRLIQSIPSKKAEPFKLWLAKIGNEFIDEAVDPELAMNRAVRNYRRLGYSENWINMRLKTIEARKALTDKWDKSGVHEGAGYAELTDLMYKTWAGMNTREYKNFKGLKKENLRDNMTNVELVLNMLAEVSATEFSEKQNPQSFDHSAKIAHAGASVEGSARRDIENRGGEVVSRKNARELGKRDDIMLEEKI
ncbi:MAG: hypothetical protein LBC95_03100 [Candidatus Nomurabacteria bacterium]|jgi:hypothetical protein|nr:hypothetical protein [Candidatus Nomurabacteria bacterium]